MEINIKRIFQNKNIAEIEYYPPDGYAEDSDAAEIIDPRTATIHDFLVQAAMKNLVTERGATFTATIPDGLETTGIELRTESAMMHNPDRPVPISVVGNEALFLATDTKAILPYTEELPTPSTPSNETSAAAAD